MIKFKTYTDPMLDYAMADCYAALEAGQYTADDAYGRKLWAEIDAIRDVQMSRRAVKVAVGRRIKQNTITLTV